MFVGPVLNVGEYTGHQLLAGIGTAIATNAKRATDPFVWLITSEGSALGRINWDGANSLVGL